MSRVQEIKKKQEIQAKFQVALGESRNAAAGWLGLSSDAADGDGSNKQESSQDFLDLPILLEGKGLSLDGQSTIGEFIATGVKSKPVKGVDHKGVIHKGSSRALHALRNQMRNSSRSAQRSKSTRLADRRPMKKAKPHDHSKGHQEDSSDSSDEEVVVRSNKKKGYKSFLDK